MMRLFTFELALFFGQNSNKILTFASVFFLVATQNQQKIQKTKRLQKKILLSLKLKKILLQKLLLQIHLIQITNSIISLLF